MNVLRFIVGIWIALSPVHAIAASATLYNNAPNPIYDTTGALARSAKAYFYAAGTGTPLSVYHDAALTTPWTYPITAGLNGVLPAIYLPYVNYRVRITTSAGSVIFDQDNIANPAPASAGGGGSTPANQLFVTGQIISMLSTTTMSGFVRMNGRTIGSSSSSGTERANDDAEDLFLYLCNNLDDTIATMGGGRGASCAADWAANKAIVVPSMRGLAPVGVDDMGTSPSADIIQTTTTCSVTNGSPIVVNTSAIGVARNMYLLVDGVAAGKVTYRAGTTDVTVDTNYAGTTGGGKTCRYSVFPNAQTVGIPGGSQTQLQTLFEMATHNHGVTDPGHTHNITAFNNSRGAGGFPSLDPSSGTYGSSSNTTGLTIDDEGGGLPSSIVQPSRLVGYFIKL